MIPWGAVIGAGAGILGTAMQNSANRGEAAKNRNFQKKMYRHRYQYTVEDMRKAGLNPALAYEQGGGSAPSGSSARMEDVGESALSGATRGVATALEMQAVKATIEKTKAETNLTNAQKNQLENESASRTEWWRNRPAGLGSEIELRQSQMRQNQLVVEYLEKTMGDRVAIAGLSRQEVEAMLRQMALDFELAGLQRAPLEAQAEFAETWYGKNVAPFVGSAQGISGIVTGLLSPFLRYLGTKQSPGVTGGRMSGKHPRFNRGRSW